MADVSRINGYDIKDAAGRLQIENLQTRIDNLHTDYYVLIGDSYAYDAVRDGVDVTGWTSLIKQWNNLTEGVDCFSRGEAGAGFSNTSGAGRNFNGIVTYLAGTMTEEQRSKVGTVVIAGGTNDCNSTNINADYVTLFNVLKSNIETLFPNVRKIFIVPVGMNNSSRTLRLYAPRLYAAYQQACRYTNMSFAWGAWYYRYDKRLETADHIHLNNAGEKVCASMITIAINGGTCGYYAREDNVAINVNNEYSNGSFTATIILQDNLITINKSEINHQFSKASPGSVTFGSSQKNIGTINSALLPNDHYIIYRSSGRAHDQSSGKFIDFPVVNWYTNGNYNITTPCTDGASGYVSLPSCDFIGVDMNDFSFSAFTM